MIKTHVSITLAHLCLSDYVFQVGNSLIHKTRSFNNEMHYNNYKYNCIHWPLRWAQPDSVYKLYISLLMQFSICTFLLCVHVVQQMVRNGSIVAACLRHLDELRTCSQLPQWAITCKATQTNCNLLINDSSGTPNLSICTAMAGLPFV